MKSKSAGLVMFRIPYGKIEVLLAHPGGPFWAKKDEGAWTIPKGEIGDGEDELTAAKREFFEETGFEPKEPFLPLGSIRQKSGKTVQAWAFAGGCDPAALRSNVIKIEWPPRSGMEIEIPEIDRAQFFTISEAKKKINPAQFPLLQGLESAFPDEYRLSIAAANRDMLFDF